jgi:hypothetical protein
MTLTRGFTDEIKLLFENAVLGANEGELLSTTLGRIGMTVANPLNLYASFPTANSLLNIGSSLIESGDGSGKSISPIDSVIPDPTLLTTIDFQTGTVVGQTVTVDGAAFSLPTGTVGRYRRVALVLRSDGTIDITFSPESVTVSALLNAGDLLDTLLVTSGLPIGWADLECDNVSGKYRTAGSSSSVIENKVGSDLRVFRFGMGGGGDFKAKLDAEITARMTADSSLQSALLTEVTNRTVSDSSLQSVINNETSSRLTSDSSLQSALNTEVTNRTVSDSSLQAAILSETTSRAVADSSLQSAINSEITSRVVADSSLQAALLVETTARDVADSSLQAALLTETTNRTVSDSSLQAAILSETTSRTVADSSLQASINAEATAREIADSSLQANISIWNTYTTASASAAVINRDQVFWDTTGGVCTATLPATPSLGATVRLIDFKGTWGTNKLVIARNGNKIQGASADLDLTVPWDSLTLVFDGVDNWHLLYS